jgi:hypothetical protein
MNIPEPFLSPVAPPGSEPTAPVSQPGSEPTAPVSQPGSEPPARRITRRQVVAASAAGLVLALAIAFAVGAAVSRNGAEHRRDGATAELGKTRAGLSLATRRASSTRQDALRGLAQAAPAIATMQNLAGLSDQSVNASADAQQAGVSGTEEAFNEAASRDNAVAHLYDTAVQQLDDQIKALQAQNQA